MAQQVLELALDARAKEADLINSLLAAEEGIRETRCNCNQSDREDTQYACEDCERIFTCNTMRKRPGRPGLICEDCMRVDSGDANKRVFNSG